MTYPVIFINIALNGLAENLKSLGMSKNEIVVLQQHIKSDFTMGRFLGQAVINYYDNDYLLYNKARKDGNMGWKEISDLIKEVYRQITNKFSVTLKLADTINIGGKPTHYHFPEGTDPKIIADTLHKPESENLIVQNVIMQLKEQHPQIFNLSESDRSQLITTSTIASIIEGPIISEKVGVGESVRVKLSPVKSINDENETE